MKLQFVKYNSIYLESCAKLVSKTWSFDNELVNASRPHHLFYYYIRNCVDNSIYTDLIIDEETERVLGILFGSDENHTTCKPPIKNFVNLLILYTHIILGHLGKRSVAIECIKDMLNVEKSIENYCNKFDGQLNLCVVSKELQGLGYGRKLIDRYIEFCKNEREMENIFLWTDINCNHGFYEHYGFRPFKQFYDDRLTNHYDKRTDKPNGFIYVKNLI
jgi:predicted GNAT family N-acyltransferase